MGFHSTEAALLVANEELKALLDNWGSAAILLLGLRVAFDTVDRAILKDRLRDLGIQDQAMDWLISFLDNRSYQVMEKECFSDSLPTICGVPHGSSLRPTMFNKYVWQLATIVQEFGISVVSYADDSVKWSQFRKSKMYPLLG